MVNTIQMFYVNNQYSMELQEAIARNEQMLEECYSLVKQRMLDGQDVGNIMEQLLTIQTKMRLQKERIGKVSVRVNGFDTRVTPDELQKISKTHKQCIDCESYDDVECDGEYVCNLCFFNNMAKQ